MALLSEANAWYQHADARRSPAPAHLLLFEDMQQVVGRELALLEDKISAVLHKLPSQDQQFVSGWAGEQLLDLGAGIPVSRRQEHRQRLTLSSPQSRQSPGWDSTQPECPERLHCDAAFAVLRTQQTVSISRLLPPPPHKPTQPP